MATAYVILILSIAAVALGVLLIISARAREIFAVVLDFVLQVLAIDAIADALD
jgi:hypothetical protein